MDTGVPPDRFEKALRFGCGLLFGAIVLLFTVALEVPDFGLLQWAIVGGGALICGFLALRLGDHFYSLFRWW